MKTGSFIHGEWIQPESDRKIINRNPANPDEILSEFPAATAKDAQRAIEAAKHAFPAWKSTPAPERGRIFARAVGLATQRIDEIARVMTQEQGKIFKEAAGEVKKGINLLEYYAGAGFRIEGLTLPSETKDCFTCTVRKPLGVVGIITPWNFPWAIPVWKITPALVAGNTVVFKPAELTPGTAALMVEIFQEAGLPAGVLNMVVGPGSVVGEAILNHADIKAVSFTGSNQIGQRVINACAGGMKKVTCELGGKNALIVMDDADLDAAATATAVGAFGSTGQRCTATSRVLVHEKIKSQFISKLLEEAKQFTPGDGLKPETTMGPSVDEKQFQTVLDYVAIGKTEAKLLLGGNRVGNKGFFMESTIFDEVKAHHRIFQEEIFGPVLSVSTFKTFEEAIELANNTEFGLSASLFSKDMTTVMRYTEEIEAGMVHVNEPTIGGEAQLPFGGLKATGYGDREMSEDGLNFYTETKTVFINYSGSVDRAMSR
jgi:alpha-ketoglutaric semialdehyde dehydrogenase